MEKYLYNLENNESFELLHTNFFKLVKKEYQRNGFLTRNTYFIDVDNNRFYSEPEFYNWIMSTCVVTYNSKLKSLVGWILEGFEDYDIIFDFQVSQEASQWLIDDETLNIEQTLEAINKTSISIDDIMKWVKVETK